MIYLHYKGKRDISEEDIKNIMNINKENMLQKPQLDLIQELSKTISMYNKSSLTISSYYSNEEYPSILLHSLINNRF